MDPYQYPCYADGRSEGLKEGRKEGGKVGRRKEVNDRGKK